MYEMKIAAITDDGNIISLHYRSETSENGDK